MLTLVQAVSLLPEQSTAAYGPWPTIRFGIVGLALYGASLVCVVASYRGVLTLILLVMIPLNLLALASIGVALVPGTALLIVALVLFWMIGAYGRVNHGGAVSNWEAGRNVPSVEQYESLRNVLLRTGKVQVMPDYRA